MQRILDWLKKILGGGWSPPPPVTPADGTENARLLALHNQVRRGPLRLDPSLCAWAQHYAEVMGGLVHSGGPYAENIAEAPGYDAAGVFAIWYNERPPDDGHRRNILNPAFTRVGFGHHGAYWVAEYA